MAGLPGLFPIYPDNPISGPFHVSLSIPGSLSEISKSVGLTTSTSLLMPNIDYLVKFANGDIGIADGIKKNMMLKNINKCKNEETFKHFAKLSKLDISDPSKYKTETGYSVPRNLITVDPSEDLMGIKSMEKTILKSIFETQKPYMEVIKIVTGSVAKIEDIIARIMPILAPVISVEDRLSIKSEKPKTNKGANGRPKALGYGNGSDLKSGLGKLNSLGKKGKEIKIDKFGNVITSPKRSNPADVDDSSLDPSANTEGLNGEYQVVSTVYSTGKFNPSLDYKYIYNDIKDDSFGPNDLPDTSDLVLGDDDPYKKSMPKNLIFGIFNSKGEVINPMSKVKSLGVNGEEVDTPYSVADWITRSPKWHYSNQYFWSRFGSPFYYWERYAGAETRRSQTKPDPGQGSDFTRKKYDTGSRKGEYIVDFTGTSEKTDFVNYFTDLVSKKINAADLDPVEKQQYIGEVISKLYEKDSEGSQHVGPYTLEKTQIDNHLDSVFRYGSLVTDFVNPVNNQPMSMPDGIRQSFKPGKLKIGNEEIWIDPESDYDLKVIKVDSVLNIRYEDSNGSPEIETQILSFIKNTISIDVDNNTSKMVFSIKISKNQENPVTIENITEYDLDNWNYNDSDGLGPLRPVISNSNSYAVEVWRYQENPFFIGKSDITFPMQGNRFMEITRNQPEWIYREYETSSSTSTVTPDPNLEYNVSGSPNVNGEEVVKVKIQKVTTSTQSYCKINSWYYKKNNITNWYSTPPNSWVKSGFSLDWQSNSTSYASNGYLPQTRLVDTIQYNIRTTGVPGTQVAGGKVFLKWEEIRMLWQNVNYLWEDIAITTLVPDTTSMMMWVFGDIIKINETRAYKVVDDGEKVLGEGSLVEVNNEKIKRWIVWRESLNLATRINGRSVMPGFRKDNVISLSYKTFGSNESLGVSINTIDIPPFQVRVKDNNKYGKMVDPSKITNNQLTHPDLYSQGKYGGSPQEVGILKRYMLTELDTETYYIIEGVLSDLNVSKTTNSQVPTEWYQMPSALGAMKVFLSLLSDVFAKLIPVIKNLLKLFKNPSSFITDVLSEKLGESFLIFSPESMKVMKKMPSVPIKKRSEFIKNSVLSNYISVDSDGNYKFLLDGSSLMKLPILGNTVTFGMQLKMLKPLLGLISKIDFNEVPNNTLGSFLNQEEKYKDPISDLGNIDLRANQDMTTGESTQYSTGEYIRGVDYQYIYLTEYVSNLIKEADDLESTNDPDNLELAVNKLELASKSDPKNKLIEDKLKDLQKKVENYTQPMLKFLIEIISLPIKVISKIIEQIMAFFKGGDFGGDPNFPGLKSLPSLPSNIAKFLSFEWLMDFFKPNTLLVMAGIKFDIPKLLGWVSNIKGYPDDFEFDLSEVINIDLLSKLPKVKKPQFLDTLKKPLGILKSSLCLLESLINAMVDFIWSLLGIESIIPAPHIKLCDQVNNTDDMTTEDIMDLLNGMMKDTGSGNTGYNFTYEIKLSDGRTIRDLDTEELRKFIDENKDVSFDFLFD